jgi:uroporphyrinogen-III decarboxylase
MNTRERLLAAWQGQEVDYVPLVLGFWDRPRHPLATWANEPERLAWYRERGWDTYLGLWAPVTPGPEVQTATRFEERDGRRVLYQRWRTPAGDLEERLWATEDWISELPAVCPLGDDFRTSRYLECPCKTREDLATLPYLFPLQSEADRQAMVAAYAQARALAEEFAVPVVAAISAGLDWLLWLFRPQEIVMRAVLEPEFVRDLLAPINAAYQQRLEWALELGVDAVLRRGWYESTDFWSPALYAQLAQPALLREVALAHQAGVPVIYQMDSGIMPLLSELDAVPFDCLLGADPATSAQDLRVVRRRLPGKALWGGISGPLHLGRGTPQQVERAVEKTFADCGREGFILGPGVGLRYDWPTENLLACDRAWRRLR